ncbi:MAG: VCBS repeat-containing protein, partial [Planctomycetota bacterium]
MRKIGWLKFGLAVLLLGGVLGIYVALSAQGNNSVVAENVLTFAVGDVNSDTYPDIILGVTDSPQTHNLKLLLNNQNGSFTDAPYTLYIIPQLPEVKFPVIPHLIKLAYINNDNLPDIIAIDQNKHSSHNIILLNSGNALFYETDNIIDGAFFTTAGIGLTLQDINNDGTPELILVNPEKPLIFSNSAGYFILNDTLTTADITPEKPLSSLEIDLDNDGTPETLKVEDSKLLLATQTTTSSAGGKDARSGSSLTTTSTINTLALSQTTPWRYKVSGPDGATTVVTQIGNVEYFELNALDPDYVWGNILVLYKAHKLQCVSIEEAPTWPAFWVWWTYATGMTQYGGGGNYYNYDQIPQQGIYELGSDWARQWVAWYGDGNAGPVGTVDPTYGQTLDAQTIAYLQSLGVPADNIRHLGAIRLYTSTYAGGSTLPLRLGFKVTSGSVLPFWCLANDWTAYNWVAQNLDSVYKSEVDVRTAPTLEAIIAQLQQLLSEQEAHISDEVKAYLQSAITSCQNMISALAASPQDAHGFFEQMSVAMENIARAAEQLDDIGEDIWYKLDDLISIRSNIMGTNLLQSQSMTMVSRLKDTSAGDGFDYLINALKGTNDTLDQYTYFKFVDYFQKMKQTDENLTLAQDAGVLTTDIRQALAMESYNFYQHIYRQLEDAGYTPEDDEWTQKILTGMSDILANINAGNYPGAYDSARTLAHNELPAPADIESGGGGHLRVSHGCYIRLKEIKGGNILDGVVQKADTVDSCGLRVALELKQKQGETILPEIKDIDEWKTLCLALGNGYCGKVEKILIPDNYEDITWTLEQDNPAGIEEGESATGQLETNAGRATVYRPPQLRIGYPSPFTVKIKVDAKDGRQHKSDMLEISYQLSIERRDADDYRVELTEISKNERKKDLVKPTAGCGCTIQNLASAWGQGRELRFDTKAEDKIQYIPVNGAAVVKSDVASDEDNIDIECASPCPLHITNSKLADTTYYEWTIAEGSGNFALAENGKTTTFVASQSGEVKLRATVKESGLEWTDRNEGDELYRDYRKIAIAIDLDVGTMS